MKILVKTIWLICLLWPAIALPQGQIRVDVHPSKIPTHVQMIIPHGQIFLLERYHFFKHNYWISSIDTLQETENGILQGKGFQINPGMFTKTTDACDTVINKIRNSALTHKLLSAVEIKARKDIGYDNKEYKDSLYAQIPTGKEEIQCHEDFKIQLTQWYTRQTERIDGIKKKKMERQQWIKHNPEKVDKVFINSFLEEFGSCQTDHVAIIDVMKINTDDFLKICKDLPDYQFFRFMLKLYDLPANPSIAAVIVKLKSSTVGTNRKAKIIRRLKKYDQII